MYNISAEASGCRRFSCDRRGGGKGSKLARSSGLLDSAKAGVPHIAGRRLETCWRCPASKRKGRPPFSLLSPHRMERHVNICRVWFPCGWWSAGKAVLILQLLLFLPLLLCMVAPLPHQRHGGRPDPREEPAGDQVERAETRGGESVAVASTL